MNKEVLYPMSQKQLNRYVTISKLTDKQLTVKEAAISLGLSTRQILRLKKGVKTYGANVLIHKNSGRKPSHALAECLREKIINLKRSPIYSNANFCHFQELLAEYEKITISYSALKRGKFDPIWTGYAHFALEAKEKSAFRPIPKGMNINHILCVTEKRIYDRGGVFSFYHKHCQIIEDKDLPHFGLKVRYLGNIYDTVPCEIAKKAKRRAKEKKAWVPDDSHYYKYGKRLMERVSKRS